MGRRPGMTLEQRHIAVGTMTAGMSARDVALADMFLYTNLPLVVRGYGIS